jgi:hypothetical protein
MSSEVSFIQVHTQCDIQLNLPQSSLSLEKTRLLVQKILAVFACKQLTQYAEGPANWHP